MKEERAVTETLMSALSECETASQAIIVLRHRDDISWHASTCSRADALGLLEFVSTCIRGRIVEEDKNR